MWLAGVEGVAGVDGVGMTQITPAIAVLQCSQRSFWALFHENFPSLP